MRTHRRPGRLRRWALVAAASAALTAPLAVSPAVAAPSVPGGLPVEVDAFPARYQAPTTCAAPRPGTLAVRQLILTAYGKQTVGTSRSCPTTGVPTSEHADGRAVDWMLESSDPVQAALAREFIDWLLAPDARGNAAANARRLGVMYVIWNRQTWKAYRPQDGWQPYTGADPHTNHIHLSLTFSGANQETSWWTGTTDPLAGHWIRLGGNSSVLGSTTGRRTTLSSGVQRQDHVRGSVYSSPTTPVSEVHDLIARRFDALGGAGSLGVPVTDETPTPNRRGAYNHFLGGSVYWSPATGAHEVRGGIRDRWAALGWENGLGFPLTGDEETPRTTGWYTHFEGGSVYASPTTGAHAVRGAIRDRWASMGWENSRLGFPTAEEQRVPEGIRLDFQGGSITWNSRTGATSVT